MKTYKLIPTTSHKSFYGKAIVLDDGKTAKLQSYNTIVAEYSHETKQLTINGWYSVTTARHVNAFLNHFGFPSMSKAEMIKEPTLEKECLQCLATPCAQL